MSDKKSETQNSFPLLPLRDVIIFPHMVVPLFVGREKSIAALEKAAKAGNELFLVTQKDASVLNPEREDVYDIGTVVSIIQMLRLPDNTVKVLIEGKYRAKIDGFRCLDEGYFVDVTKCPDVLDNEVEIEASMRSVKNIFEQYVKLNKRIPPELLMSISSITDPSRLADIIVAHLTMKIPEKQQILDATNVDERLQLLLEKMQGEIEIINVEKRIRSRVKTQMEKSQKEYYLNEQMNAIQKELGNKDDKSDISEMEDKLKAKLMPEEAREKTAKEIRKLKSMSPMSAEAAVVRNYVDWMLSLPWGEMTEDDNSVNRAKEILDNEHFGLTDVKERIVEYLAVRNLTKGDTKGTLLCLAGPPGVGKTSIATSLANSLGRKFVRISLGGVRDEAEIRGHRRTYVGAMPGRFIQAMKQVKSINPVIMLDEIDKLGSDFRGDPSAALLEVLDPEQNNSFRDNYLNVPFDLSNVMFIATANMLESIPGPLRDRMEVISLSGYSQEEKVQISKKYLIPKQMDENGITPEHIEFTDEGVETVITGFTREAGLRNLERQIGSLCRKVAKKIASGQHCKTHIFSATVEELLGPAPYGREEINEHDEVGVATGLAWTAAGGEILKIEATKMKGRGITLTGQLGEVMKESAQAAMGFIRSNAATLGIDEDFFEKHEVHVHLPAGAIPKDGPSAGITLATVIVSLLTGSAISKDIAMTGEITLTGKVLPVGGIKEKALAAMRAGIETIIIPWKNQKDLLDIPEHHRKKLNFIPVKNVQEVLALALVDWNPQKEKPSTNRRKKDGQVAA